MVSQEAISIATKIQGYLGVPVSARHWSACDFTIRAHKTTETKPYLILFRGCDEQRNEIYYNCLLVLDLDQDPWQIIESCFDDVLFWKALFVSKPYQPSVNSSYQGIEW